jgi:hypothetical protein
MLLTRVRLLQTQLKNFPNVLFDHGRLIWARLFQLCQLPVALKVEEDMALGDVSNRILLCIHSAHFGYVVYTLPDDLRDSITGPSS